MQSAIATPRCLLAALPLSASRPIGRLLSLSQRLLFVRQLRGLALLDLTGVAHVVR